MKIEKIDGFGEFEIHSNYLVGRVDEGVDANETFVDVLTHCVQKHFSGRPIGYVSNRKYSYSTCPVTMKYLVEVSNVRAIAVVTYTKQQESIFSVERMLLSDVPIESFGSLDKAVKWVKKELQADLELIVDE